MTPPGTSSVYELARDLAAARKGRRNLQVTMGEREPHSHQTRERTTGPAGERRGAETWRGLGRPEMQAGEGGTAAYQPHLPGARGVAQPLQPCRHGSCHRRTPAPHRHRAHRSRSSAQAPLWGPVAATRAPAARGTPRRVTPAPTAPAKARGTPRRECNAPARRAPRRVSSRPEHAVPTAMLVCPPVPTRSAARSCPAPTVRSAGTLGHPRLTQDPSSSTHGWAAREHPRGDRQRHPSPGLPA